MLPAVAQGAVGIEHLRSEKIEEMLAPLNDSVSKKRVEAERAFLWELDGSCRTPIGGLAQINNEEFKLSPEFLDGYTAITDSKVLDRLIQQGMTDLGLPPGALKDFTQQVKEKLGDRYLNNFDVAKNDSLFGWLTGKSGGRGESIIYRAKGDVMNDYKKAGEAETSSLDAEIGCLLYTSPSPRDS